MTSKTHSPRYSKLREFDGNSLKLLHYSTPPHFQTAIISRPFHLCQTQSHKRHMTILTASHHTQTPPPRCHTRAVSPPPHPSQTISESSFATHHLSHFPHPASMRQKKTPEPLHSAQPLTKIASRDPFSQLVSW